VCWSGIWELSATRALDGYAAGVQDANSAGYSARGLGAAPGSVVVCTVDFDAQFASVSDYVSGFASAIAAWELRPMLYGSVRIIDAGLASGMMPFGWQAEAWSYGMESPYAHVLQRIYDKRLSDSDHNDIYKPIPVTGPAGAGSISSMGFSDDQSQRYPKTRYRRPARQPSPAHPESHARGR
jgi:hypothetical protein